MTKFIENLKERLRSNSQDGEDGVRYIKAIVFTSILHKAMSEELGSDVLNAERSVEKNFRVFFDNLITPTKIKPIGGALYTHYSLPDVFANIEKLLQRLVLKKAPMETYSRLEELITGKSKVVRIKKPSPEPEPSPVAVLDKPDSDRKALIDRFDAVIKEQSDLCRSIIGINKELVKICQSLETEGFEESAA